MAAIDVPYEPGGIAYKPDILAGTKQHIVTRRNKRTT